eukprot:TRINITY_DN46225_c0_g1_i1.p1 TRINITY_DN46225_c0_g1~~TRINITY_DN46225_c0_g1_i1.p1  ORF type:complete len:306 (+),score=67.12 TRINITY_DN46225_c0_g1_i1:129-920(+)
MEKPGPLRNQSVGTPFSQASTAPPTPAFMSLKQPAESSDEDETAFRFERLSSGCSDIELNLPILPIFPPEELQEAARACIGMPPLQSELGKWAQWQAQWEEANGNADGFFDSDDETGSECATDSLVGTGNEEEDDHEEHRAVEQILPIFTQEELQEEPRVSIGMLPLQSELGKWAQWQVRWEQANGNDGCDESDDEISVQDDSVECVVGPISSIFSDEDLKDEPRRSFGMAPLQSELGKWAQWQVQWEAANGNDSFFFDGNAE